MKIIHFKNGCFFLWVHHWASLPLLWSSAETNTHNVNTGIFLNGKNDLKCAQIKHISGF